MIPDHNPPDTTVTESVSADDLAQQIDDAYSAATENVCTCGSDPEGWCRYCGEWEKARRFTRAAISSMPALEEENRALRRKLAELGVTLIDDVDAHIAILTNQGEKA